MRSNIEEKIELRWCEYLKFKITLIMQHYGKCNNGVKLTFVAPFTNMV